MQAFGFRHLRHMRRYRQIANILARHGFGLLADQLGLGRGKNDARNAAARYSAPERARMALEDLGPTYIKLGQLLSTRPDILPPEYIYEFEKLQDNVAKISRDEILKVIEDEGIDINQAFVYFDPHPLATASIGQVHRARLQTGQEVAVKVQKPGIQQIVESDLDILFELARVAENNTKWGELYQVSELVEEFADALRSELDYMREGRNAERFKKDFADHPHVVVPEIFWEYSTRKVLVMEYIGGIRILDIEKLRASGYNLDLIAERLIDTLFVMIYEHSFFHADPHPGNIAVGEGEKIILYDFGQVGSIDEAIKEYGMDLILAMSRYDANAVTRALMQLGVAGKRNNRDPLRRDVARLMRKYYGVPLSKIEIGESLAELMGLTFKHQVRVPPELALTIKMLMTLESLVSQLDPNLSLAELAEPYGKRIIKSRFSMSRIKDRLIDMAIDYSGIAKRVPKEIESILELMEEGEFKIKMEISNIKELASRIDIISNRLAAAIVIASLIIGTGLITNRMTTGFMRLVPLAEIGFVLAMILGLYLVYSVMRSGRY
ncbi:MAG: ABC1 kinase family protein [Acidobacteriota bacterium]